MYMLVRAAQNVRKLFNETHILKKMEITMKGILLRLENETKLPNPEKKFVKIDYLDFSPTYCMRREIKRQTKSC